MLALIYNGAIVKLIREGSTFSVAEGVYVSPAEDGWDSDPAIAVGYSLRAVIDPAVPDGKVEISSAVELIDGVPTVVRQLEDAIPVFPTLSPRQLQMALVQAGTPLASVETALDNIADPLARELAKIEWNKASYFEREDSLLLSVAQELGFTTQEIDSLWMWASTL